MDMHHWSMHSQKNEPLRNSFLSEEENFLVKKIVLTHDPDGRQIDSQMLLQAMENVMFYATMSSIYTSNLGAMPEDKTCDDLHESLGQTLYTISQEILWNLPGDQDLQARAIMLLDLLKNYSWDAKIVIVLAAFATSYGEFWLIIQLNHLNPLALSVAKLKHLPKNLSAFKPRFKALNALVRSMVDVTKYIVEFEDLRVQQRKMDDKAIFRTNSEIYVAAYWVIRSTLACSSLITDLIAKNQENLTSTTTATWELSSLVSKMTNICGYLQKQEAVWHTEIENKVHQKLLKLFMEPSMDNQEALHTLLALRDDMPLNGSSAQQKLGVSELLNKVIILLISKPDLLPLNDLLFLLQQTCSLPDHDKSETNYKILWVPISSSSWSDTEIEVFNHLSNILPWYSVRQPWFLTRPVVKFMRQVWNFRDEPKMVVLDPQGRICSQNAISMVFTWGATAYPFSVLREEQLWRETNWSLKLVMGDINPLMSTLVEEGRLICLYGSHNLDWIREFTSKIKAIIRAGVELELVYVGTEKPGRSISYILNSIAQEKLSGYLSVRDIHCFWLRLKHMYRSKLQIGILSDEDHIQKELESILNHDDDGWALFGKGNSPDTVHYHGTELMECLDRFTQWASNIGKFGFLGSIASAFDPPPSEKNCCQYSHVVPYVDDSVEETVLCEECKCPMKKFVLYQCQGLSRGT